MFDKLKQGVNATKFKADQLIREQRVQGEIGQINQQAAAMRDQLAVKVLMQHQQAPLGFQEIDDLCVQIDAVYAQINEKQQLIAAIRAEQPPVAPPPQPGYGQPPMQQGYGQPQWQDPAYQGGQPPMQPGYGQPQYAPPAQPQPPYAPPAQPQPPYTPPVEPVSAAPAPAVARTCPNCQASVPAGSAFCTNCGKPLG